MNISGVGAQAISDMARATSDMKIKPNNVVSWQDFQDQVKSQVQADLDNYSLTMVKSTKAVSRAADSGESERQPGVDAPQDQTQIQGQVQAEADMEQGGPVQSVGQKIDRIV